VFDFEGFKQVIDRVGGVEICVEREVRDPNTEPPLSLPAGCSLADGGQTLAWVRSRKTQELVDGVWSTMPGVNDLTRNERQQQLLLEALQRLKGFRSVTEFADLVEDLSGAFAIDETLSITDAIGIAWDMRDLNPNDIARPTIPVAHYVTEAGAYVLLPQASFADVLLEVYPGASEVIASG
jgi:anionic cell wall polymer biosynthesis LytR-Cps2A-Psr (LCP) family protein